MRFRVMLLKFVLSFCIPLCAAAADSVDFNQDVLPVFRKYCNACHNSKDGEGGLVLQDYARTMQGGTEGASILPGKSGDSLLWKRISASDETRMPPQDQAGPTADDMAVIRRWIDEGAKAPAGTARETGLITPKIKPQTSVRGAVTSVACSPDGQTFAIARAHEIEVHSPSGLRKLSGHAGTINEISFSKDGQWLCVAAGEPGLGGEATLWKTADWSRGPVFQGHRDALYSAQLSPAGQQLATASYDRDLITWDVATGAALQAFQGHNEPIYSACFSPSGKLIATASGDRTVKLWDALTGQRLDTFSQPAKDQTTVVFSPDGHVVAAGGADARIRIWQISESGREGTNPILYARFAHEGPILKLVYSPDGRLLASASEDFRIKIWETKTYTQIAVLEKQTDWASSLAFTADSQQLLVGRMDGEHQFYPIDPRWLDSRVELARLRESTHSSTPVISVPQPTLAESEPNDSAATALMLTVPSVIAGELKPRGDTTFDVDYYQFEARQGEQFVLETTAARDGSLADTKLDVLYPDGTPVLRALLQAVRDSWINFRPIDSSSPDVRLEFWEEMDLNQYVYFSGEVCRTFRAPQGPDSGYQLYSVEGKRRDYFDTSGAAHAKDEPAYIVEAYPPDSRIVENGLPVFPVYFSNDDDGERKLGKDSRLTFTAPRSGSYLIKVSDVRGFSGDRYTYRLNIRRPDPDFAVTINTMNPKVPAGGGQRLKFTVNRIDQFDGPVRLDIAGLPAGFEASSPTVVQAGLYEAFSTITASADAPEPKKADWDRITVLATADIDGQLVTRTVGGLGEVKLDKPAPIRVKLIPDDPRWTVDDTTLVIEPGTTITAKIVVERNGHEDDIRFDVDNLPHGIIVDNIGLSGVLVRKHETERQIFLTARPWVPETERQIHAVAQGVGNQASPAIRLLVRNQPGLVAR